MEKEWSSCRVIFVAEVAVAIAEQEVLETFLLQRIRDGVPLWEPIRQTRRPVVPASSGGANANEPETHGLVRRATAVSA